MLSRSAFWNTEIFVFYLTASKHRLTWSSRNNKRCTLSLSLSLSLSLTKAISLSALVTLFVCLSRRSRFFLLYRNLSSFCLILLFFFLSFFYFHSWTQTFTHLRFPILSVTALSIFHTSPSFTLSLTHTGTL